MSGILDTSGISVDVSVESIPNACLRIAHPLLPGADVLENSPLSELRPRACIASRLEDCNLRIERFRFGHDVVPIFLRHCEPAVKLRDFFWMIFQRIPRGSPLRSGTASRYSPSCCQGSVFEYTIFSKIAFREAS
jgi:hypothetical protein